MKDIMTIVIIVCAIAGIVRGHRIMKETRSGELKGVRPSQGLFDYFFRSGV